MWNPWSVAAFLCLAMVAPAVERLVHIGARSGRRRAIPDPPRFERCVAGELRRLRERERRPSRRRLRRACRERYERLRDDAMHFVVQEAWVRQETAARGIAVTPDRVRRSLERQKRAAFPEESDYRTFLRRTGQTEADILRRVELDLLQRALTRQVTDSAPPVTRQDVDRYFEAHRRRFRDESRRSARRTIRRLLTAQRRQRALDRFVAGFRAEYRAITVCADDYVVAECGSTAP